MKMAIFIKRKETHKSQTNVNPKNLNFDRKSKKP